MTSGDREACCQIKCPPLKSISSYLSVQLPFRLSFPHSQMLPLSSNSFSDSRVHLSSWVSTKRWHQSPASPAFLFIPLLFVNTACVVFGAISHHWMRNILVCFPLHFSSSHYRYFSYKHQTYQIEWILPYMHLTCRLGNNPEHTQILSETLLRTSLAR